MKSEVLPSFWKCYSNLPEHSRQNARKAYLLWSQNPFHPSLHFKCVNRQKDIWSVRISKSHRAIGIKDGETITWIWVGNHDEYEKFFG